jgi:pimeloyl-ACP methyl ester carboxylesterase
VRSVVLVHGLAGSPRWWKPVVSALSDYDVTHVDPRTDFDIAADAILIGHSFGGLRAAEYASEHPLHKLVLVAPAGISSGRHFAVEMLATAVATTPRFVPTVALDALRWGPHAVLRHGRAATRSQIDLARIRVPTLLVWGERDTLVPTRLAEQWHAGIVGSHLEVIAGAKHLPMLERPAAFNEVLLKFLHELGD